MHQRLLVERLHAGGANIEIGKLLEVHFLLRQQGCQAEIAILVATPSPVEVKIALTGIAIEQEDMASASAGIGHRALRRQLPIELLAPVAQRILPGLCLRSIPAVIRYPVHIPQNIRLLLPTATRAVVDVHRRPGVFHQLRHLIGLRLGVVVCAVVAFQKRPIHRVRKLHRHLPIDIFGTIIYPREPSLLRHLPVLILIIIHQLRQHHSRATGQALLLVHRWRLAVIGIRLIPLRGDQRIDRLPPWVVREIFGVAAQILLLCPGDLHRILPQEAAHTFRQVIRPQRARRAIAQDSLRPLVARRDHVATRRTAKSIQQGITLSSRSQRTRRIRVELRRIGHREKQLQVTSGAKSALFRQKSLRLSLRLGGRKLLRQGLPHRQQTEGGA